ncbi:hypothetical protein [Adhaeribacter aquaticus]|uniref:hypothetical protein n=1 Tax=Adhaeribacter aquaticus TaxID=299567 RepID=UPI000406FBF1|nr:hypothetical protein [Adhaeribacter aquaticus]
MAKIKEYLVTYNFTKETPETGITKSENFQAVVASYSAKDALIQIELACKPTLLNFVSISPFVKEAKAEYIAILPKWQNVDEIKKLKRGNVVRNRGNKNSYVVDANYGDRVTAICSVDITNPDEWEVLQ